VEPEHVWTLRELDLFADLTDAEVDAIGVAAPMRPTTAGELLVTPDRPAQVLFIVKSGRVRVHHLGRDGRRLTTAIVQPGELFGEMVPLGQHVDGGYAEALEDGILCVMTRADVQRLLLSDARIAGRIAAALRARVPSSSADCTTGPASTPWPRLPTRVTRSTAWSRAFGTSPWVPAGSAPEAHGVLGTVQAEGWALLDQYKGPRPRPRPRRPARTAGPERRTFQPLPVAEVHQPRRRHRDPQRRRLAGHPRERVHRHLPAAAAQPRQCPFHPVHPLGGPSTASVDPRSHAAVPGAPALAAVLAVSAALTSCIRIPASRASGPPRM
jgi:CRP/FNR family transcriptional regulator, cyclic AMP receptor protein